MIKIQSPKIDRNKRYSTVPLKDCEPGDFVILSCKCTNVNSNVVFREWNDHVKAIVQYREGTRVYVLRIARYIGDDTTCDFSENMHVFKLDTETIIQSVGIPDPEKRRISFRMWDVGGTVLFNVTPEELYLYQAAVQKYGNPDVSVQIGTTGDAFSTDPTHSIHYVGNDEGILQNFLITVGEVRRFLEK